MKGNAYKYHTIKNVHKTWVRGIAFIKAGDDYLLASFSEAGYINVFCMKERISIYNNTSIPDGVLNMLYSERCNALIINSKKYNVYTISLETDQASLDFIGT